MSPTHSEQVRALLAPVVADAGFDLEDVTVTRAGRRRLVRVVVDRDGGATLDDIALVSRVVSGVLDAHDDVMGPGAYVLEVSSPGVDRPLTQPRHYRRARGRMLTVERDGRAPLTGRVVEADDAAVTLRVGAAAEVVAYAEIRRARVEVEFNRPTENDVLDEAAEAPDDDVDGYEDEREDGQWTST